MQLGGEGWSVPNFEALFHPILGGSSPLPWCKGRHTIHTTQLHSIGGMGAVTLKPLLIEKLLALHQGGKVRQALLVLACPGHETRTLQDGCPQY